MPDTLTTDIKASLSWLFQDAQSLTTIADSSRLEYAATLPDGDSDGQADKLWHDVRGVAVSAEDDLDLADLGQTIFGSAISVAFLQIKALLIVNTATAAGEDLLVGGATADAWDAPFGEADHQVRVPADACLLLVNKKSSWLVDGGSHVLRIANQGSSTIEYKIALVGVAA